MSTIWDSLKVILVTLGIALAVGLVLTMLTWLVVDRIGNSPYKITEKKMELTTVFFAITAIIVGAIYGVHIPNTINRDNNNRDSKTKCFTAVISLRKTIDQVEQGYLVAPAARDQRLADWTSLGTELENTSFACQGISLRGQASKTELRHLRDGFASAKAASEQPRPDAKYLQRVAEWSLKALQELQSS